VSLRLAVWLLRHRRARLERQIVHCPPGVTGGTCGGRFDRRLSGELDRIIIALEALAGGR
jgi:hypothetical protein